MQVMKARYGLDGVLPQTLDDIGRNCALTREAVRQIEAKALHKLRQPYRNYRVREFALDQLLVQAGVLKPAPESVRAAEAAIASAEAAAKENEIAAAHQRLGGTNAKQPEDVDIASQLHTLLGASVKAAGGEGVGEKEGSDLLESDLRRSIADVSAVPDSSSSELELEEGLSEDEKFEISLRGRKGDMEAELRDLNAALKKRRARSEASDQLSMMDVAAEERAVEEEALLSTLDGLELVDDEEEFVSSTDDLMMSISGSSSSKALDRLQSEMKVNPMSLGERAAAAPRRSLQAA